MEQANELYGVNQWDAIHLANAQIGVANYLLDPLEPEASQPDFVAHTNEEIWARVLAPRNSLWANMTVTLKDFYLFEWFPRTPGLYFTPEGQQSREFARQHLRSMSVPRNSGTLHLYKDTPERNFLNVYDPDGKMAMLKGGIGCIHLKPKVLRRGESCFLSASSNGVAHQGFPTVLTTDQFTPYFHEIQRNGALRCTITGTLRFMPDPVAVLYSEYRGVPMLYLEADEIAPEADQTADPEKPPLVSVGISFMSTYEGPGRMYASYATFRANEEGSLADTVNWLDEIYVRGLYSGKVITDFDEQTQQFEGATFALTNIMNNRVSRQGVVQFLQMVGIDSWVDTDNFMARLNIVQNYHVANVERMVKNDNRRITFGDQTTIHGNFVAADNIENSFNPATTAPPSSGDLHALLRELVKAVNEAAQNVNSAEASNARRDARHLEDEATSESPRSEEGMRLGERIAGWAKTIGETGKPIIELVSSILPLLSHAAK